MKKNYIGLGTSPHDPSIAIVNHNGEVVFAEDTERYLQNKRAWCSPPDDFIRVGKLIKEYCDPEAEFVIATSWRQRFFKQLQFAAFGPLRRLVKGNIGPENYDLLSCIAAYANRRHGVNTECQIRRIYPGRQVIRKEYEHHLTHSAAACLSSTFTDAASVVVDGLGENTSMKVFHYKRGQHIKMSQKSSAGSLGQFYSTVCELCGFDPLGGEEWKVMGLAPYGKKNEKYYALLRELMVVDGLRFKVGKRSKAVTKELQTMRRKPGQPALEFADFAFTAQQVFADYMNELLRNVHRLGLSDNLVLSGGCALNSAYMGGVTVDTPFKNSYVFCAPADNGNSVGAALLAYREDHPQAKLRTDIQNPYLGSTMDAQKMEYLVKFSGLKPVRASNDSDFYYYVAEKISRGKIIAWVQGRAEFGPRALGNRSILADPRHKDVKELINEKVKFREEFRPFAPSILAEHGAEYFENYCQTPYMERALTFRPEVREKVPGVVHVDGTGRLQTVKREWNEKYYALIDAFYQITGVPVLLNTSFNVMGKPIVHSVEDALAVFLTSGIDLLVIDDYIFDKELIQTPALNVKPIRKQMSTELQPG